jgi:hypothetical protein
MNNHKEVEMKRRLLSSSGLTAALLFAGSCFAEINEVGIEWINICNPCGNSDLSCRDDVAVDFYDILRANGYLGRFNFGNASAWESDFKEPNDQYYVDSVDIALHADHGGNCRFAFGNTSRDDCRLRASEAEWGNQDLEWIILDDCSVLPGNFGWDCWIDAFQGLHLILSFDTSAHDVCSRGEHFANKLVDGWTLKQAWFYACEQTEGAGTYAAVVGASKAGVSTANDHIWGFGSVASDPTPATSWWWTHHHCD